MGRAVLILANDAIRQKALRWVAGAKPLSRIEFKGPARTLDQNSRLWASLTELSEQLAWRDLLGRPRKLSPDQWKLYLLDALNEDSDLVPSEDGSRAVNVGRSSSDLSVSEFSDLLEVVYAFGARHGVTFTDFDQSTPRETGVSQRNGRGSAGGSQHGSQGKNAFHLLGGER